MGKTKTEEDIRSVAYVAIADKGISQRVVQFGFRIGYGGLMVGFKLLYRTATGAGFLIFQKYYAT